MGVASAVFIVVVGPTVIDNVGVKRTNLVCNQALIDLVERLDDVLVRDLQHVVEPGIVLDAEVSGNGDVIDVVEEVGLDHGVVRAAGRAGNRLPRGVVDLAIAQVARLAVQLQTVEVLARVVAGARGLGTVLLIDMRVRNRELAAKEHTIDIEGLAQIRLELLHLDDAALAERDGPRAVAGVELQRLQIDVVDLCVFRLFLGNGDVHELTHVVVALEHHHVLDDRIINAAEVLVLEHEGDHLAGFTAVGNVLHHGFALELELAGAQGLGAKLALGHNPFLRVEVELLATSVGQPVLAALRLEHDALNVLALV